MLSLHQCGTTHTFFLNGFVISGYDLNCFQATSPRSGYPDRPLRPSTAPPSHPDTREPPNPRRKPSHKCPLKPASGGLEPVTSRSSGWALTTGLKSRDWQPTLRIHFLNPFTFLKTLPIPHWSTKEIIGVFLFYKRDHFHSWFH